MEALTVRLKRQPNAETEVITAAAGLTVEQIVKMCEIETEYPVYACRINNKVQPLTAVPAEEDEIVLLDMRDSCAKEIYQRSVIDLFRSTLARVYPEVKAIIGNSLNRGIFFEISSKRSFGSPAVEHVEKVMKQIVSEKVPFTFIEHGLDMVVPDAGYIGDFDLRKCRSGLVIRIPEDTHPGGMAPYVDNYNLYKAFQVQRKWSEKLDILTCADLNQAIEAGQVRNLVLVSEALQEKKISHIADDIIKSHKRIVLIAGPSSSGKTTFAHRLCTQLWVNGPKPVYMGTDDYYLDRDQIPYGPDGTQNFENLDSIDVELFNEHLKTLLAGGEVDLPRFDFNSGKKVFGERKLKLEPDQPMVIEGIHGLNEALTPSIPKSEKYKIYISPLTQLRIDDYTRIPLTDTRKLRRIVRDAKKRGWDARQTIEAWPKVRAGEDINIFPYSDEADNIFNSAFVYELAALKKDALPMLTSIPEDDEYYTEAQRLARLLSHVATIEDDHYIPNNSILREFIGGSIIA
ncbi:MAG: nucleoside kinase [Firmicutes bacterium]|nr:nucleoside kinase [Bacillota bacterium]